MKFGRLKDKSFLSFLGIALLFLILKVVELQFKFSDGFTYMYMGKLILQGVIPYRDFFFASPPLQVYLLSFFEIFTGGNVILLKLIPIFATLGSAFFIYEFMKKKYGGWQGFCASSLFLFSFLTLLVSDYSTGINLTLFFILGMVYFTSEDKPFIAGIFASLALLTRLYAPFPILGTFIYYILYKRKKILKFLAGTLILFLPISILFQIISNGEYLNQIFFFRLHLISGTWLSKWEIVKFFILGDFILVLGSLFYFFYGSDKKRLALPILTTLTSVIFYFVYSDFYYLYFGLIIGFLAIFTTRFIFEFSSSKIFHKVLGILILILILINSFNYISNYATASNMPFTEDAKSFVQSNSNQNDTIYGSFEVAPLIALLSERKIAGNIADTNPKNILTSEFSINYIEEKISGVRFIIGKGFILQDGTLAGFDASTPLDYINKNCNIVKEYPVTQDLNGANIVVVWKCDSL